MTSTDIGDYALLSDCQSAAPVRNDGTLERLVEHGLVEARGECRDRVYHLSAPLYRELGEPAGYVRMRGFDAIRQEAMILEYVAAHGRITRREVVDLCRLDSRQARYLLQKLVKKDRLQQIGTGRGAHYILT